MFAMLFSIAKIWIYMIYNTLITVQSPIVFTPFILYQFAPMVGQWKAYTELLNVMSLWEKQCWRGPCSSAIYSASVLCEVPPPLTVTSLPAAGRHGTMVHCLRRHAQLGGWVSPGLRWGLLPRSWTSHFLLSSTPSVPTTDRVKGLGAYWEALPTGDRVQVGHGHAFLGVWHGI